jgi:hypothetical protein
VRLVLPFYSCVCSMFVGLSDCLLLLISSEQILMKFRFEPEIPAKEGPQTLTLDRSATGIRDRVDTN